MPGMPRHTRRAQANPWILLLALAALIAVIGIRTWRTSAAPVPAAFDNNLTLTEAEAAAEAAGKPVLILATADWCGPCQRLKKGPLVDETLVERITEKAVPVYLDVTNSVAPDAAGLRIKSVPALIMVDEGQEVGRIEGYHSAADLARWLDSL